MFRVGDRCIAEVSSGPPRVGEVVQGRTQFPDGYKPYTAPGTVSVRFPDLPGDMQLPAARVSPYLEEVALFAGIGGFCQAARRVGIPTVEAVEIDSRSRAVLRSHFPEIHIHDDIKTYSPRPHRRRAVYSVGFPCTDTSGAGRRTGIDGEFSGLWWSALRAIAAERPAFVAIENPLGLLDRGLRDVLASLRIHGYCWDDPQIISAEELGGPQLRERLFTIAYASELRWSHKSPGWANTLRGQIVRVRGRSDWPCFEPSADGVNVRIPARLGEVPLHAEQGSAGRIASRILFGRAVTVAQAEVVWLRVLELARCVDWAETDKTN